MKTILRSEVENTQTGETGSMEPWGFPVGYRLEELRCQVECHILTYFNVIFFTFFYKDYSLPSKRKIEILCLVVSLVYGLFSCFISLIFQI